MTATEWKCTNREYHADHSRIGSTMLKTALRSLAEYRRKYVDPLEHRLIEEPSDAMVLGSLVDCLVLEPDTFDSVFAFRPDGIDGRTTDGKKKLAAFRASCLGKQEVEWKMVRHAKAMANAVLAESAVTDLLADAVRQRAVYWEEDGLILKARTDIFIPRPDQETDLILDLKSAADPTPECFRAGGKFSPIRNFQYDLQLAHYRRGMFELTHRACAVGLIVVGKDDPYDVFLYDLSAWLSIGDAHRTAALDLVRRGKELGWRREDQGQVVALSPTQWDMQGVTE